MEETTLNEALEKLDEDFAEEELEEEEVAEEEEVDFEYDDEGNIVFPDDEEENEGDEEANEAEVAEEGEDNKSDEAPATETKPEKNADFEKFKSQARDTLAKFGIEAKTDAEIIAGLVNLAAENDGKTPEEYLAKRTEEEELEAARKLIQQQKNEVVYKADLDKIHEMFPETSVYTHIKQLPNYQRFSELRALGNSVIEAYSATHTNAIRESAASGATKLANSKNHLRATATRGAKDTSIYISKGEMESLKESFPDLSDKEIVKLYKRAKN